MHHKVALLVSLLVMSGVGTLSIHTGISPNQTPAARTAWMLFLVFLPLALGSAVWIGWTWAAMACVVYGTIGLALDLATVTSILGSHGGADTMLVLSGVSGGLNLLLIIFGGRSFWSCLQGSPPRVSHPPSPPSPSSS